MKSVETYSDGSQKLYLGVPLMFVEAYEKLIECQREGR
jgi:hypothetical protein